MRERFSKGSFRGLQAPFRKKIHFYDGNSALLWKDETVPVLNPLESKASWPASLAANFFEGPAFAAFASHGQPYRGTRAAHL
ncbi:hypothetical protein ACIQUG_18540 [Ensifer sp. NPDC090286]|uniref:hypothetical protein n=1 Tax=Ensifer sp. NPDC090286 TaxID=3363991 RepID=UPI00383AD7D7